MSPRLQRAHRLAELAKDRVDAARMRVAEARRAVADAMAEVDRCEGAWCSAALVPAPQLTGTDELERQSAHLRTLRLRADAAARRVAEAQQVERRADEALVEAMKHRRKLELWSERLTSAEQDAAGRAEARAADELAARTVRQRP